ncbi:hypothetical protein GGE24_003650 [Bradyrhizobium centrosematis]|nr:hypothetical protein [Bradyrhizobium centrosematis]MCS3774311.1 hypothetical protein [Bradyrhizobium centrosematis]
MDFFEFILLYAYFRYFDFRLVGRERLTHYRLLRVLFTSHESFNDQYLADPLELSVHPAKAWWAFVRPIIVMLPVYGAGSFSPRITAMFAAVGLILLLSPSSIARTLLASTRRNPPY